MLCMETYFFCFSVRLGILISATLSFISLFIPWILMLMYGLKIFQPIIDLVNDDTDLAFVSALHRMILAESTELKVVLNIVISIHMLSNILAIYGALQLKKQFVIPLAVCEFIRVIYGTASHIIIMQACHNQISLSLLIVATLAGGFILLFWAYSCCACIAFYQIIELINSSLYQQLYGNDPFNPIITPSINHQYNLKQQSLTISKPANDIIISKKNYHSIFESKNTNNQMKPLKPAAYVSVLPDNFRKLNLSNNKTNIFLYDYKKDGWQNYKRKRQLAQLPQQTTQYQSQQYSNSHINYNYWQWRELAQY